jgi:hypothetical protein
MSITFKSTGRTELRVTPQQVGVLRAALRFANARQITSTKWVEDLFKRVSTGPVFRMIEPSKVKAYIEDQRTLKKWLTAIARGRGVDIEHEVSTWLGTLDVAVRFNPRRHELEAVYLAQGVQPVIALASALLLDRASQLTERVSICGDCGRFVVDLAARRGPIRRFCTPEHRIRAYRPTATEGMRKRRQQEARTR